VTIASGSSKNFTFDVTQSMQTMTAYIVEVTGGDAPAGSTIYYSLYAVGMTLFLFTFAMNMFAKYISNKFREGYYDEDPSSDTPKPTTQLANQVESCS